MAYFDATTNILHGRKEQFIYRSNVTLGQVLMFHFRRHPNQVIQVNADDGREITCGEMADMMENVAKNLHQMGYRCGDTAALIGKSTSYVAPTFFACSLIGIIVSAMDPFTSEKEIASTFHRTKPRLVFCDKDVLERVKLICKELNIEAKFITLTSEGNCNPKIVKFFRSPEDIVLCDGFRKSEELCLIIVSTSGTTGAPKMVKVSHAQFLQPFPSEKSSPDAITFRMIPLNWISSLWYITQSALHLRKNIITSSGYSTNIFIDIVEKFRPTDILFPTSHVLPLIQSQRFASADFSSVKVLMVGGLNTSAYKRKILEEKLTNGHIFVIYGMSEVGVGLASTSLGCITTSIGQPTPNTQVKILKEDGSIGGFNEYGELLCKTFTKPLGYFENSKDNDVMLDQDGWIHTGDMCYIDKNLEIFFVDRKAYVIKTFNGTNVFPSQIEDIIEQIPSIEKVCATSFKRRDGFETPLAFAIKMSDSKLTEEDVKKELDKKLESETKIVFLDSFPISATDKIRRNLLKIRAAELFDSNFA